MSKYKCGDRVTASAAACPGAGYAFAGKTMIVRSVGDGDVIPMGAYQTVEIHSPTYHIVPEALLHPVGPITMPAERETYERIERILETVQEVLRSNGTPITASLFTRHSTLAPALAAAIEAEVS